MRLPPATCMLPVRNDHPALRAKRFWLAAIVFLLFKGCGTWDTLEGKRVRMKVTAYCSCGDCTGWERNWCFQPVYNYGSHKGESKVVGLTASGEMAFSGSIAADRKYYPLGTRMYVDGYGMGSVQDVGGAIKGSR